MRNRTRFTAVMLAMALMAVFPGQGVNAEENRKTLPSADEYTGDAFIEMNGNVPYFTKDDLGTNAVANYAPLDDLGRCQAAFAIIGQEGMPTEERGQIGQVKPSGWHTVRYDDLISDKFLYNRCHLVGFQLAGANADERNLITGTRYLNITGMLPFENEVADYVKDTGNHVAYRVTPVFEGDDLVAQGVLMEGQSVEDDGVGIQFNVFCYNVQPGVTIDYATGESWATAEGAPATVTAEEDDGEKHDYIVNLNSKTFHLPTCSSVDKMSEKNKKKYNGYRSSLINNGYSPCQNCNP